jgi:DNA ligase-1
MTDLVALSGRPKNKLVQLALDLSKVNLSKLKFPMLVSEKLDGVFCLALKLSGKVEIFSRTGELYTSMRHIEEILEEIMDDEDIIIFEAYTPNTVQAVISGRCRDTKEQHPELMAGCHDLIGLGEFIFGGGNRDYLFRSLGLKGRIDTYRRAKGTKETYWTIFCVAQKWVQSLEEAQEYAAHIWDLGGEGAVLRNPQGFYAPGKRNSDIIKLKQGVSFDLAVLDGYEGEGKYKGVLGGLICKWKNGKTIQISGMTDEQRRSWWANPELIKGKIVQVDAMCESSKGLLREPRFKGIRTDKTEGDF